VQYKIISNILSPVFQLLRPIPPIAFVPIVILWFGLSELGKWFLVFWGVFFTVWLATHYGVQRADKNLIRAAQCLGTPERYMMQEVLFPSVSTVDCGGPNRPLRLPNFLPNALHNVENHHNLIISFYTDQSAQPDHSIQTILSAKTNQSFLS